MKKLFNKLIEAITPTNLDLSDLTFEESDFHTERTIEWIDQGVRFEPVTISTN